MSQKRKMSCILEILSLARKNLKKKARINKKKIRVKLAERHISIGGTSFFARKPLPDVQAILDFFNHVYRSVGENSSSQTSKFC